MEDDIKFSLEGKDSHGKFKGEIPKILVKNADPDELLEMFDAIPSSSNLFAKLDNGTDQEIKVGVDTDGIENQNYVTLFPFPGVKDAFELDDDDREYIFDADKNDHIINDMVDRYFERKKDERWD